MTVPSRKSAAPSPSSSPPRRRRPWLFVVVAILTAILLVSGELWAIRRAAPLDGAALSVVASDLDRALARVAAASLPIVPAD
ncbi:MAG TPA: hypothetical protein VF814_10285 [Casimicrobiaceae bacterium]